MNSVKRRGGGRPNRGGGRGNRPKRGPPGEPNSNVARKGTDKDFDPDDLAALLDDESFSDDSSDDEWTMDNYDEEDVVPQYKSNEPMKPPERRKVEMAILHMSDQSQESVINMLKVILLYLAPPFSSIESRIIESICN